MLGLEKQLKSIDDNNNDKKQKRREIERTNRKRGNQAKI